MRIEDVAKICHEANKALCESLYDDSQVDWDEAPNWQKESAKKGVVFNIDNPDAPASSSHDSWLAEKKDNGWKYGEVKNAVKKEHPCFVPYDELPKEQQAKDHLFKAVVGSLKNLVE